MHPLIISRYKELLQEKNLKHKSLMQLLLHSYLPNAVPSEVNEESGLLYITLTTRGNSQRPINVSEGY